MKNDPKRAGQLAAARELFGPYHRYSIAPVHSRFGELIWFVWDSEIKDEVTGASAVIRQEPSREAALESMKEEMK